jgi:ADP-heptose:LPS heptosyltransferase
LKPATIRRVDAWLGQPMCFLLTAARRCVMLFRPKRHFDPRPPRKILFIKMTEQGATVLAYAAVARAIELVGRENVYFWVFEENRPILDLMGIVPPANVITVRATGLVRFGLDVLGCLKRIRSLGIDATVDMEFFARASAILAFLTGAARRAGLHRFQAEGPYRGDLLTHRLQWNPYLHTTAAYYVLVEALMHDPAECPMLKAPAPNTRDFVPPPFVPSAAEVAEVRSILERAAGAQVDGPVVILNPNASDMLPLRKWPQERFVEVATRVLEETPDAFVAFSGAPSEREAAEALARAVGSPRAFSLAGVTSLRQLLVLYTLADVLVTNDSGPGHFSALTDIDTVVLFGPETPALYGPLGHRASVLYANLACSPCVNALNHRFSPCRNNVCMQLITVQQVLEKVRSALARRRRVPATSASGPAPQTAWPPN